MTRAKRSSSSRANQRVSGASASRRGVSPKQTKAKGFVSRVASIVPGVLKVSILLGVMTGAYFLWPVINQPVQEVEFAGDMGRVDVQKLRAKISESVTTGILMVDIEMLDANVESMGWVYAAEIQKQWPNRLIVEIEEELPVARWGLSGYLAASGKFVESKLFDDLSDLPAFDIQVASPKEALDLFYGLNTAMNESGVSIKKLQQTSFGSWSMEMENGSRVVLGKEDLMTRIHRVMRVWQRLVPGQINKLEAVDARYPNGIAIKYQERTTDNPA